MLISQAQAAETAHEAAAHGGSIFEDPTFWVAGAFILFVVIFGKKLGSVIGAMLDERAQKISDEIEEATRLREEAQELLASLEKKQHEALKEAEAIVAAAKEEAERLAAESAEQLEHSLKRSEQLAKDRIAQAEAHALAEVKSQAVDLAMAAAKTILEKDAGGKKADALIEQSIKELDGKLH